jgi:hypothetical protein
MSDPFKELLAALEWLDREDATGIQSLDSINSRVKDIQYEYAKTHDDRLPYIASAEGKRIESVAHKAKMTGLYGYLREFEKKLEPVPEENDPAAKKDPKSDTNDSSVLDAARSSDDILKDVIELRKRVEEMNLGSDINREGGVTRPTYFFMQYIILIAARQMRQSGESDQRILEYLGSNPLPPKTPLKAFPLPKEGPNF